jgi:F0F1-type ATP synthase assembly protein I
MTNWTQKMQEVLNQKTENYTSQEKVTVNFEYLKNLLIKIEDNNIPESELLCSKIEEVINGIQPKTANQKIQYKTKNLNDITNLQTFVKENFNYIPKGKFKKSYTSQGMVLGMSMGVAIGVALEKIAIGLPVGMVFGIAVGQLIGNNLDRKAEIENRVL